MKKILSLVVVFTLCSAPLQPVVAANSDELDQQIAALQAYIERNYRSHEDTRLAPEALRRIITNAVGWMTRAQEKNGHFAYEYDVYEGKYLDDDHIVRQGGALYELGEIARYDTENRLETHQAIEQAIGYFETLSEFDTDKDILFVVSLKVTRVPGVF